MITKAYFDFFKGLASNNSKEWYDANKKAYETDVKKPLTAFVAELIDAIRVYEPELHMEPKDAMFRINRDVRFSKNKEPYKTSLGALISPRGKKDQAYPSFYIEIGVKGAGIAGGAYMPDKEQLATLRDLIVHEGAALNKLLNAKSFAERFGEIRGDKNKILPPEFKAYGDSHPLLFHKQFYYWADLPAKDVIGADAVKNVMAYYKAAVPVQEFLRKAF